MLYEGAVETASMTPMAPIIRPATEGDLPAIAAIYNDAVRHTTAIWNETVVDVDNRRAWHAARLAAGYPVLVGERDGAVVAYGSFGDFRAFDGYRFTVEHSVYVAEGARRLGIASALVKALADHAAALGKHVMVAGIAADNAASTPGSASSSAGACPRSAGSSAAGSISSSCRRCWSRLRRRDGWRRRRSS